jgi:hypothetical protein
MRLFDNWWEHLPAIARSIPLVIAVLAFAVGHPLPSDYHWE